MNYLVFVVFSALLPFQEAAPSPDTNVQIQNYDGPIFLHAPKFNCCPLCNSVLNPSSSDGCEDEKITYETNPENYPRKAVYGNNAVDVTSKDNGGKASEDVSERKVTTDNVNTRMVPYEETNTAVARNTHLGSVMHKERNSCTQTESSGTEIAGNTYTGTKVAVNTSTGKGSSGTRYTETVATANTYSRTEPAVNTNIASENAYARKEATGSTYPEGALSNTYKTPSYSGNTYSRTAGTGNSYSTPSVYTQTGVASPGNPFCGTANVNPPVNGECTKPLSNYLPINCASQNSCYRIPIVCNNQVCEDETVLVPQKFTYSLILDGEVAPSVSQNGPCDYTCYCYC